MMCAWRVSWSIGMLRLPPPDLLDTSSPYRLHRTLQVSREGRLISVERPSCNVKLALATALVATVAWAVVVITVVRGLVSFVLAE